MKKKGKAYLIGAGPGDPGLLTLKGKKYLSNSDVIIYDNLINPSLLNYAKEGAKIYYVGKKSGQKELSQNRINKLLIDNTLKGKTVVRLKGGDPFIFGRGGEEAIALVNKGVDVEIIPGVSSVSAAPSYAGIPLTHRDHNSSFLVATGHEDPKKSKSNLPWRYMSEVGTLVFLMGLGNIKKNMKKLMENGKSPSTPAAVISRGTYANQKTIIGTIENIASRVDKDNQVTSPAVIIIGDVIKLRDKINWYEKKPLFTKKVIVTRAKKQSSDIVEQLSYLGAEPIEFPSIEISKPKSWNKVDNAIRNINKYDWLVFTSTNGVESFFDRLKDKGIDIRELNGLKIAAIGQETANAINKRGILVNIIPEDYRAEGLINSFSGIDLAGKKFLIPRAKRARKILPDSLKNLGAKVDIVSVYETKMPNNSNQREIRKLLKNNQIDIITFTSSSTAKNFISTFPELNRRNRAIIACIGPITANTVRKFGLKPDIISKKFTVSCLLKEIEEYFV